MGFPFLERTLFTRNTSQPHSYVVGFKYVGDVTSKIIYGGEISSDTKVSFISQENLKGENFFNFQLLSAY